ncbi:hypothetical protein [Burkholderia pseudomultivorans]|uniref:Uncharacterized protein n=1 Tax=Burkholderia pseudomultivorans TaxID=1207504 RepID=A0A132EDQ4_9BURK|nr:hypothetical protein [Burkholderia pseudomultivorans]KWF26102.1 hypothetical protein WT56_21040 [Burkholderia pseudomultivorans]
MKRMLLAAVMLASTLGVGHAQTQTFHFGEGQAAPQAGAPTARPAPARPHRHAVHKRRHARHVKPTRGGLYTRS